MSRRFARFLPALSVLALMAAGEALACAVCYGDPEAPMTKGLNLAIISLGLVIGGVLAGIVAFAVNMNRRARALCRAQGENVR